MIGTSYVLNINGADIEIKIARSTGRNVRMSFRDMKGRISIPRGTSQRSVETARTSMDKWLRELSVKKPHLFAHKGPGALEGATIDLVGVTYELYINTNTTNSRIRGKRKDGRIIIELPPQIVNDTASRQKYIPRLLSKLFASEIEQRIQLINERTIKGKLGKVTLRSAASRWGSCTGKNDIMISNRLLLAPVDILDHVIVHELAHTIHKDHSIRFWRLVAEHDSQMRRHHHWLKINGAALSY